MLPLPPIVVSKLGKRNLNLCRQQDIALGYGYITSKVSVHHKNWTKNAVTGYLEHQHEYENEREPMIAEARVRKTVWNRDIVAAKCILIKGKIIIMGNNMFC